MKLNGFYGSGSGRLGEAVAANGSNGAIVWRKYNPKVKQPNTEAQQLVKARFKVIASIGTAFKPVLRIGMHHGKKYRVSYVNNFIRKNWDMVSAETPETAVVALDELLLSNPAAGVVNADYGQPDLTQRNTVTIAATLDDTQIKAMYPDVDDIMVHVAVYQADLNQCVTNPEGSALGSVSITTPNSWSGMRAHIYAFVVAHSPSLGYLPSATTYVGSGNLS